MATRCILLDLSESEVSHLSNFMGHNKSIHKSHYRQSIPEVDIPRFSRLLNVALFNKENGKNSDFEESEEEEDSNVEENKENICRNTVGHNNEPINFNDIEINDKISSPKISKRKKRSSKFILLNNFYFVIMLYICVISCHIYSVIYIFKMFIKNS